MKKLISLLFLFPLCAHGQKKPLDHSVYDGWQSVGEKLISNNGEWVVFTVTPQEGDAVLYIRSANKGLDQVSVPRGYNAVITEDDRFVVFRIRPTYKETRDARIKKKKPEDMPKDSIGIVELGKPGVLKVAKVKSYKTPQKAGGWLAYQKEKDPITARPAAQPTQRTVDSLRRTVDSLVLLVTELKNIKGGNRDGLDADEDPAPSAGAVEGSDLVLRNLARGTDRTFRNVADYAFNPTGRKLLIRTTKAPRDSFSKASVIMVDLASGKADTILKGGNDFRSFTFTEDGSLAAFVAERDTNTKALQKFYGLYLYKSGNDSAQLLIDKGTAGMELGMTVSENATLQFSKSGKRLLFGTAPIKPAKDTTLVDIDLVKLDVWNYKDDYLQTQQLFQLGNELKRSYLAAYDLGRNTMQQLGSPALQTVVPTGEGDGTWFIAVTDTGRRVASQWSGNTLKDIYAVNATTGTRVLVRRNHDGSFYPSATGRYILLYDNKTRNYLAWDGSALRTVTAGIKVPLYNEENDTPDDPNPYGVMAWHAGDSAVYIYDRYDAWKVDPMGVRAPVAITSGRKEKVSNRYIRLDPDERFISGGQDLYFRRAKQSTKENGIGMQPAGTAGSMVDVLQISKYGFNSFQKARDEKKYIFTWEDYSHAPDLWISPYLDSTQSTEAWNVVGNANAGKLTSINPQQATYNWGTAELYKWTASNGKPAEGILYKPEDFDPSKKYPMIIYFYEKLTDGLYSYSAPSPTPSRLNIPFFVSRGYLVFAPDISYTKGHPGKDAVTYVVSGAQALSKNKWVDAKNIGIQGQSWGGYQVAYLITATDMFKAAWAGAPVVNMFSAYGGIRWESGNNRQFQYEKGQSRIGATPWERPDLYLENSPFFHLQKVKTPLVIMSNDADGAVPWYQGIEFFTAMRRLNKPVWLLNYNGEAHNLVERRNRKDIQVREQQYFDWLLKGEKPPTWITEGVPAVRKGIDWGLGTAQ
ncbi:MAG: family peptidase [Flaviaesturariibacter sp.]|nr:family peptidase [Flaviaesturariibacter sp.]